MPYKYVAYTDAGIIVKGSIEASSEQLAKQALIRSGYKPLSVKAASARPSLRQSMPSLFGVKAQEVIVFSRQLATLVERGINALHALRLLKDQVRNPAFREIIGELIKDVQQGSSLAEAIAKHPNAFPPLYSRMVKVSEQTGDLEQSLRQTANYMEREIGVMKRARRVMLYPAFIAILASGVIAILVTFTLPPLIEMFNQFDTQLPLITRLFLGVGGIVTDYTLYLLFGIAGIAALIVWFVKSSSGRRRLDRLLLKMPLIGTINRLREVAHFGRTTSLLLNAGLSMPETMELTIQTTRNVIVRDTLKTIHMEIMKGQGLSTPMSSSDLFPPVFIQMVKVGEQTGTLTDELMAISESYEQEVDERVNNLLALMEPLLLVGVGLFVAFIAVSVIMPIYTMMGAM